MTRFSRRAFLRAAGTAISSIIASTPVINTVVARATPSRVRRSVGGMTGNDPILLSYCKAIQAMKALPPDNPLSWCYQAAIHGTWLQTTMTAWKTCEHHSEFFWPWHRMYLYWFERIVAKMADDPYWTLPYWNYTSPDQRQLPMPFRDPSSPLYAKRAEEWNNGMASFTDTQVDYSPALIQPKFIDGSASIENSPHSNPHALIQGLMRDKETAAQDPIFFLHHSNIDRLWDIWLAKTSGASDPVDSAEWKENQFVFFDENGYEVRIKPCDVLRAQQQLGYTYEGEPPQSNQDCTVPISVSGQQKSVFVEEILTQLPGFPPQFFGSMSFQLTLDSLLDRIRAVLTDKDELLFLNLSKVENDDPPPAVWDVYVGPPEGELSGAKSAFFVGTLAFFQTKGDFKFPINRALTALIEGGNRLKAKTKLSVAITLAAHGPLINGEPTTPLVTSPTRVGGASLSVQAIKRVS